MVFFHEEILIQKMIFKHQKKISMFLNCFINFMFLEIFKKIDLTTTNADFILS